MGLEIERKFLVDKAKWDAADKPEGTHYSQGYILNSRTKTVRVRVDGKTGYLNMKSSVSMVSRKEFEYKIPLDDALEILEAFAGNQVEKVRYKIPLGGKIWEVDVFSGDNEGLIVAEIELEDENEAFEKPGWIGEEVTHDGRYANSSLSEKPYKDW